MEVSVAAVLILGALVLLRWTLIVLGAALILHQVDACPACFEPTLPIRRPVITALLRIADWRWCPACGWQGPSRRPERTRWTPKNARSRA